MAFGLQRNKYFCPILHVASFIFLLSAAVCGAEEGTGQAPSSTAITSPAALVGKITTCKKTVKTLGQAQTCKEAVASPEELRLVANATDDLNKILASPEFKEAVLAAHFQETDGKTNQNIYDLLVQRSPIHIDVTLFTGGLVLNHFYKTQGFEDDDSPGVCFGNRYAIQGRRGFLGSLMLHEIMHILGFSHYDDPVSESVPYTMNTIYDSVAQKLKLSTSYTDAEIYP